jgi:hypothetical protein
MVSLSFFAPSDTGGGVNRPRMTSWCMPAGTPASENR